MANTNTASITPQHRRDILSSVEPKRKAPAKNIGEGMSWLFGANLPLKWSRLWRRKAHGTTEVMLAKSDVRHRRAPKAPIAQAVNVRFTAKGQYEFIGIGQYECGIGQDKGASNIVLCTDCNLSEGEQVEVMLTLPSHSLQPMCMQVKGKVVRVEESPSAEWAVAFKMLVIAPDHLGG